MLGKRIIKFKRLKIRSNFMTGFRRLGHICSMHLYNLCSCIIYATVPGVMPQNAKVKPPLKQHRG